MSSPVMGQGQDLMGLIKHSRLGKDTKHNKRLLKYSLIAGYLGAIVIANLSVVYFGPPAAIWNAFFLIGFDLVARDGLHEVWQGRYLWPKMLALIAAGSLLSWWLNADAGRVALASFAAFSLAGGSDAIIYAILGKQNRLVKMNGSNFISSIIDSFAFVLIADLPLFIIPAQIAAKISGGFIWSLLLALVLRPSNKSLNSDPKSNAVNSSASSVG